MLRISTAVSILAAFCLLCVPYAATSVSADNQFTAEAPEVLIMEKQEYVVPAEFAFNEELTDEYKERLCKAVDNAIEKYGVGIVNKNELWAVMSKESGYTFNHFGQSHSGLYYDSVEGRIKRGAAGEYGLCQMMRMWRKNVAVKNLYKSHYSIDLNDFDITILEDNVACCVTILVYCANKYSEDTMYGHYNGGGYNNRKYGKSVKERAVRFKEDGVKISF